jgi:hypothetical protein
VRSRGGGRHRPLAIFRSSDLFAAITRFAPVRAAAM